MYKRQRLSSLSLARRRAAYAYLEQRVLEGHIAELVDADNAEAAAAHARSGESASDRRARATAAAKAAAASFECVPTADGRFARPGDVFAEPTLTPAAGSEHPLRCGLRLLARDCNAVAADALGVARAVPARAALAALVAAPRSGAWASARDARDGFTYLASRLPELTALRDDCLLYTSPSPRD